MNNTSNTEEKPWLTFLKQISNVIQTACTDNLEEGLVSWQVKEISPEFICIELKYIEEDDTDFPTFHMFVSKRYFNNNMVRLHNITTDESHVMQADPKLILAWMSF